MFSGYMYSGYLWFHKQIEEALFGFVFSKSVLYDVKESVCIEKAFKEIRENVSSYFIWCYTSVGNQKVEITGEFILLLYVI